MESDAMDIIKRMEDDIIVTLSKPTVMVAIPAYNKERKIYDIVLDDGSKYKTIETAEAAGIMIIHPIMNMMSEMD